jgi:error-prone DNA polymerase
MANLLRGTQREDAVPALPQASEGKEIVTDCRAMGFTLDRIRWRCCAIDWLLIAYSRPSSCSRCAAASSPRACGLVTYASARRRICNEELPDAAFLGPLSASRRRP